MRKVHFDRRTFLRVAAGGISGAVALPPLDAMLDGNGEAYADGSAIPRKFLVWFFGNGVHIYHKDAYHKELWVPPTTGENWTPSELLEPVVADPALKSYVNVVSGLNSKTTIYAHDGPFGVLCGSPTVMPDGSLAKNGQKGAVPAGPSVDQILVPVVSAGTKFKSLEFQTDIVYPVSGGSFHRTYLSHLGRGNGNYPEQDPRQAFKRLFSVEIGSGTPDPTLDVRRSILDGILADSQSVLAPLGAQDRQRVDLYLENLRSLEKRLTATPAVTCEKPAAPAITAADVSGPSPSFEKNNKIWTEMIAIALACDLTRVITYQFSHAGTFTPFKEIGQSSGGHKYAHSEGGPQNEYAKSIVFTMARLADSLKILHGFKMGDGNLLDHTCALVTSELSRGYDHDTRDWPVLFVGRAGGALRYPGIHWRKEGDALTKVGLNSGSPRAERPTVEIDGGQGAPGDYRPTKDDNLSRVGLTALWAMGHRAPSFGWNIGKYVGKVTSPLTEILTGS